MTANTLDAFRFNIQDIPVGLVTYPPGTHLPKATESSNLEIKGKIKSILKLNFEKPLHPHASSRKLRQVKWSQTSRARVLIQKGTPIEEDVQEGKVYFFFRKHGAIQRHLPGGDTGALSTWSRDPEDVKEVKAITQSYYALRSMDDKNLLKNYNRLFNKLKHIYSQKRSVAFQKRIQIYLNKYQKEIKNRNLTNPR